MIEGIRAFLLSVLNDASESHIQMAFIVTIRHSKISGCCQQSPRYLERQDGGKWSNMTTVEQGLGDWRANDVVGRGGGAGEGKTGRIDGPKWESPKGIRFE